MAARAATTIDDRPQAAERRNGGFRVGANCGERAEKRAAAILYRGCTNPPRETSPRAASLCAASSRGVAPRRGCPLREGSASSGRCEPGHVAAPRLVAAMIDARQARARPGRSARPRRLRTMAASEHGPQRGPGRERSEARTRYAQHICHILRSLRAQNRRSSSPGRTDPRGRLRMTALFVTIPL